MIKLLLAAGATLEAVDKVGPAAAATSGGARTPRTPPPTATTTTMTTAAPPSSRETDETVESLRSRVEGPP